MRRNWLEWAILVSSVAALLGLVGFLVVAAVTDRTDADIRFDVRMAEARETEAGWLVPVSVRNEGGEPAAGLTIEASAEVDGAEETSDVTLDLLPAHSEAEIVVGLSAAPDGELRLRVLGFEAP